MTNRDPQQQTMIREAMQAVAERRPGRTKLVYDKTQRTIVAVPAGADLLITDRAEVEDSKRYRFVIRCDNIHEGKTCGTELNNSNPMNADEVRERWQRMMMCAPLNAQRCPACEYSTFSDCNWRTKVGVEEAV